MINRKRSIFFIPTARSRTITLLRLNPGYRLYDGYLFKKIKKSTKKLIFSNKIKEIISNKTHSQHLTGGVCKVQVHFHRNMMICDYW